MTTDLDRKWVRRTQAALKRKQLREKAIAYKGGKCLLCGYDKCPSALDFHHPDPQVKEFTISDKMTSWDTISKELAVVDLLCCRCHREVHDGLHPGYLIGEDRYDESYDPNAPEEMTFEEEQELNSVLASVE